MITQRYLGLTFIATILAFCVILLGTYTRLKDAGLGCPDWPGCYGQLIVPHTQTEIMQAIKLYPSEPVITKKAWVEMVHRYFAGTLELIIFGLAIIAAIRKFKYSDQPLIIPLILSALVIFQAMLGMWTVTWKLLPLVVMGHLVGGMTILALLWWLMLKKGEPFKNEITPVTKLRFWTVLGLIIVILQIFLGGWTSANYASLACTQFPYCNLNFPLIEFHRAFNFLTPIGVNYQGGDLEMPARVVIHMAHRYWAGITALYVAALSLYLIAAKTTSGLRKLGWFMLALLMIQLFLGYLNIKMLLPMHVALAHNGVAALLLLSFVTLMYRLFSVERRNTQ
jgi:cytochrome c oxidase assembly protein subunit 15